MIGSLEGNITQKTGDAVLVETGGLGYDVFLPAADLGAAKVGSTTKFYIYEHIREDAHTLYGFGDQEAKQFFIKLLSISGIGPKVGMAILSATSIDRLKQAIGAGDPDLLKGVSGVGKKTAERIIMELKGKFVGGDSVSSHDSAYMALVGLGYTANQAAEAVAAIPAGVKGDQARIKAALQMVAK